MQQFDMTKGRPYKRILRFIFPIIIGNIFQQFYNMADTVIVGRFIGKNALAAVGSTGTIMFLIIGFIQGITSGFSIITAQKFGSGNIEEMKKSIGSSITLTAIITVIGTAVSVLSMDNLLKTMNTPDEIFADAKIYIIIICLGLIAIAVYNLSAAILRAIGNSRVPLYFLVVSAVLNIILDLVFIINFKMGTAGAALATVISQGVSGILCIIYIKMKIHMVHIERRHLKLHMKMAKHQISIGIPMALQYSITAIGTIMVQSTLNMFGVTAVAGYTAANKIENLFMQPFLAMGVTLANYCAQNKGINDYGRIRKGVKAGFIMNSVYGIAACIAAIALLPYLIPVFVSEDVSSIMEYAKTFMFLDGIFFVPLGFIFVFRESLQGAGYAFMPMMAGVVELTSRSIMSIIAAKRMSYELVCLANGITWTVTGIFIGCVFLILMKKAESLNHRIS